VSTIGTVSLHEATRVVSINCSESRLYDKLSLDELQAWTIHQE
jgi:hypothetical protein